MRGEGRAEVDQIFDFVNFNFLFFSINFETTAAIVRVLPSYFLHFILLHFILLHFILLLLSIPLLFHSHLHK